MHTLATPTSSQIKLLAYDTYEDDSHNEYHDLDTYGDAVFNEYHDLLVQFKSLSTYIYRQVPKSAIDELFAVASVGGSVGAAANQSTRLYLRKVGVANMDRQHRFLFPCTSCKRRHVMTLQPCPECNGRGGYIPMPASSNVANNCMALDYRCDGCDAYRDHLS